MLTDKNAIRQVLGCLMKKPALLSERDKYSLQPGDFTSKFERYIFIAILNLYTSGAQDINEIDVDTYLSAHKDQYIIFQQQKGIDYLQDALDMSALENFEYYYNRIKKFNCLRDLQEAGYDTSRFYCENELDPRQFDINQRFETLTPKKIFEEIKKGIYGVEREYVGGDASVTADVSHGIEELLEKLRVAPDVGPRFQGKYFNTITRGARQGKYYIVSLGTGVGKSRFLVGEACYQAFPVRFDSLKGEWKITGNSEKTLFIATEQDIEEIQTMVIAYLSDINEEVIISGRYTEAQMQILKETTEVIKKYKDNLQIVRVPMPSVEVIKSVIRQNCLLYDIRNVFFDYIFSNPALLNEFRDLRIREDVALLMLSTALKDLAVEQNVFMMSATQVNSNTDGNEKGIKNQNSVRGARSIIDKADIALIGGLVPEEQLKDIAAYVQKYGMPTQVQDVYKVRRGKWTNLKIWSQVDLGTCRRRDLFVTDANFKEIAIESIEYNFDDNYGVYNAFIHHLNGIEVDPNTGEVLEQKEKYAEPEIEVDENAGLLDVKGNIIGAGKIEDAPVVESSVFGGLL